MQVVILSSAQSIIFGVRDNQFARIGCEYRNWGGILEQSVFATKFRNQVGNGYISYKDTLGKFEYKGIIYYGFHYNKLYHSYGSICEGGYMFASWCYVEFGIRPHYDSSYGYETAYLGKLGLKLYREIYLITSYTNYPEYRLCEKRVRSGLIVTVGNLAVKPEISIPIKNNLENVRLLISFSYQLSIKK